MFFETTQILLHQGYFSFSGCCADYSSVLTQIWWPQGSRGGVRVARAFLERLWELSERLTPGSLGPRSQKRDDLVNPIRTPSFEELGKIRIIETPSVVNGRMGGLCLRGGGEVNLQLFWELEAYYIKYNNLNWPVLLCSVNQRQYIHITLNGVCGLVVKFLKIIGYVSEVRDISLLSV